MSTITRRHALALSAAAFLSRALGAPLSEIKLGVTSDEIDDDLLTALKFLREYNLGYVEIRNIWGKYNTALPVDKIQEARKLCDENSVKTSILSTPFFRGQVPADTPEGRAALDNQWALLSGAFERAKIMGTDKLRTFAFTYPTGS